MASKAQNIFSLSKHLLRFGSFSTKVVENSCVRSFCHSSQPGSNVGGVSLQSLPGNRLLSSILSAPSACWVPCRGRGSLRKADTKISMNLGVCGIEKLEDFTPLNDEPLQDAVTSEINTSLDQGMAGRLYAVVYIRGIQHKVTAGDVIVVKYDFPPNVGDQIRLEKVMAVGGKDFSLIGQPILSRDAVRVNATVVEKTLSHNRVWFVYRKRRSFKRFHLYREVFTVLAINSVVVARLPEQKQQIEGEGGH